MDKCSVLFCERPVFCRDLCSRHYNRLRTTGTTDDGLRARAPLAERLWAQVRISGPDDCWPWIGKSITHGYGVIGLGGREAGKIQAHRAAWIVTHGGIPEGEGHHGTVIRHKCDNRLCCNPAHLEPGTQGQNVADMWERGGGFRPQGSLHPRTHLTEDDVRSIRASTRPLRELAQQYGIALPTVKAIRCRHTWKHVQ